jgi:peptidoglycan hydrolase FlgJ
LAISPPSDIVLDVVRAADPAGVEAARAALANRAGSASAVAETFALHENSATRTATAGGSTAGTPETFKRFEAMVLQTFIQSMLPNDSAAVYGKGMAGDMWKSLLAEKVADSMAERGGIGISDRVLGKHYAHADNAQPLQAVDQSDGADGETDSPAKLAPALIEDMLRRLRDSLVLDLSDSSFTTTDRG